MTSSEIAISGDSIVVKSSDVISTSAGGESVALGLLTGKYYHFDEVGSKIWALLDDRTQVNQICGTLLSLYDIDEATCMTETLNFLQDLRGKSIVTIEP